MKILFAIAESYPLVKVGGLADVGGALPKMLARLGHDVRLVLPRYRALDGGHRVAAFRVPMGRKTEQVHVHHHSTRDGVKIYTLGNERYFRDDMVYGGYAHADTPPFILFSKAVIELASASLADGWEPDVIHCNDWHTGLAPAYARGGPRRAKLEKTGIVLSIHNLAYQGHMEPEAKTIAGLAGSASPEAARGNMFARGISSADIVNTVSQGYLEEILTPEHGMGLDGVLRSRRGSLYGVLNGVDYEEFGPGVDPHIAVSYDAATLAEGKQANKLTLQRMSGLRENPEVPLLGMVARLVEQKGVDVLCEALHRLDSLGAQVVVAGRGERLYQLALAGATAEMPGVGYIPDSREAVSRQVYAGSDLFLAPSDFEPCGLGALIALRYGAVPLVRQTGGLKETIRDYREDPESSLGFGYAGKGCEHLVDTAKEALEVYGGEEWEALRRRAVSADFSWERSARLYEELYSLALEKRRRSPARSVAWRDPAENPVPVALVHHANQFLITDGYDNREGITELIEGYASALRRHERLRVPANLHLSGTLIEAAAWHHPWFLELVRELRKKGLLELIGGTYSENIMPLFDAHFNRAQLEELLWLYEHHLDCPPSEVETFWVPERVWDAGKLAPTITDPDLPNNGYRYVLLDERLQYPVNGNYANSPREAFDSSTAQSRDFPESGTPCRVSEADGLILAPISEELRYRVPPRLPEDWRWLESAVSNSRDKDRLLVYADDMEKTAGVGPWDRMHLRRYENFLRWISTRREVRPVLLSEELRDREIRIERKLRPGAYRELSRDWNAGEDYRGWSDAPNWESYRVKLGTASSDIAAAEREGVDEKLLDLARKHLMASAYETAWHEPGESGWAPAAWARAAAAHASSCHVILQAARWFARPAGERYPSAKRLDIDGDGEREVVLRNKRLYAVISPGHGGRVVYLFALSPGGGVLVVGNPTDDWNWQEDLNRYMDCPANHPGAFADAGFEHDRYEVFALRAAADHASVELINIEENSDLFGSRKSVILTAESPALMVRYETLARFDGFSTESCISPDYLRLLREGRAALDTRGETSWRGCVSGDVSAWLALDPGEGVSWGEPDGKEAGHGMIVCMDAPSGVFHALLGCGPVDESRCRELFHEGRRVLEHTAKPITEHSRIRVLEVS